MSHPRSNKDRFLESAFPESEAPFSIHEYRQRHRRIRERMSEEGIDLLYLSAPESIGYATGYQAEWYHGQSPSQWGAFSGVAIHVDHDRWIHLETEDELLLARITSVSEDIRIASDADMLDSVMAHLTGDGWLTQGTVVGLEMGNYRPNRLQSEQFQAALEARGGSVKDATQILRSLRRVKSGQELSYIRTAQRIADVGMQAAIDKMTPGMTELDVYAEIVYAMARAGGENPGITMPVAAGTKSACVHGLASRRKLMHGDIVNVDVSGVYFRYHANMARTFSLGEPHPEVAEYMDKTLGALDVVSGLIKPGLPAAELMRVMETYYRDAGSSREMW